MQEFNESVKERVRKQDGHRCQLCGGDKQDAVSLHVHHIENRGMGGKKSVNVEDNLITLCSGCHGKIHPGVSVPTVRIVHWDREDKENGLIVERREGAADAWESWPKCDLWFYKRQDAEMLEKEINLIRQVQMTESKHAEIMLHVSENYSLISDAASFAQFVAGLGLDSNRAKDEAKAAKWIEENGLTWADGVNVRKVILIASAMPKTGLYINNQLMEHSHGLEGMQYWLTLAVDMSYSDLRKALIEKGLKVASSRWYIVMRWGRGWIGRTRPLFVRSRDYEEVLRRIGAPDKVIEINAFRAGITWDRKRQVLLDGEGRIIPFETWEAET